MASVVPLEKWSPDPHADLDVALASTAPAAWHDSEHLNLDGPSDVTDLGEAKADRKPMWTAGVLLLVSVVCAAAFLR